MRKLTNFLIISFTFLLVSCTLTAKPEQGENKKQTPSAKGEVVMLDKASFLTKVYNYQKNQNEWVYEGNKPCIIDFYAEWCGPCKRVAPILHDLALLYKNDIIVYKINVDNEKELASTFGIQSIPAILFVPLKGKPQMSMGAMPREEFVKKIDGFLLAK